MLEASTASAWDDIVLRVLQILTRVLPGSGTFYCHMTHWGPLIVTSCINMILLHAVDAKASVFCKNNYFYPFGHTAALYTFVDRTYLLSSWQNIRLSPRGRVYCVASVDLSWPRRYSRWSRCDPHRGQNGHGTNLDHIHNIPFVIVYLQSQLVYTAKGQITSAWVFMGKLCRFDALVELLHGTWVNYRFAIVRISSRAIINCTYMYMFDCYSVSIGNCMLQV